MFLLAASMKHSFEPGGEANKIKQRFQLITRKSESSWSNMWLDWKKSLVPGLNSRWSLSIHQLVRESRLDRVE